MYTSRMFDMWSTVSTKLEQSNAIQSNIQTTSLQNQSSGSIKGKLKFNNVQVLWIRFRWSEIRE